MSFKPVRYDRGKVLRLPVAASTSLTKFSLAKWSSGYLDIAAAGDDNVWYCALETVDNSLGAAGAKFCDVIPIDDETQFDALCSTTPVQATHVGNYYDLTDAATVNLGASTDDVFYIQEIRDATNKIVRGTFQRFTPQS